MRPLNMMPEHQARAFRGEASVATIYAARAGHFLELILREERVVAVDERGHTSV